VGNFDKECTTTMMNGARIIHMAHRFDNLYPHPSFRPRLQPPRVQPWSYSFRCNIVVRCESPKGREICPIQRQKKFGKEENMHMECTSPILANNEPRHIVWCGASGTMNASKPSICHLQYHL